MQSEQIQYLTFVKIFKRQDVCQNAHGIIRGEIFEAHYMIEEIIWPDNETIDPQHLKEWFEGICLICRLCVKQFLGKLLEL